MTTAGSDASDNYGWDQALDADVEALLNAATTTTTTTATTTTTTATSNALSQDVTLIQDTALGQHMRLLAQSTDSADTLADTLSATEPLSAMVRHADYPDLSQLLSDITDPADNQQEPSKTGSASPPATDALPSDPASASPLARFRTAPRKPFSVSDLTAGAWCELQYEYTLTRLPGGRRTRTAAMRAGTRVHARLEEQVHTTVRVDVATREDGFGLRLWNLVQGLRTLRETGLTRELEIWGLVNNDNAGDEPQVVNGVIDALSYQNPDPSYEPPDRAAGTQSTTSDSPAPKRGRRPKKQETPVQSTRITDFFPSPNGPAASPSSSPPLPSSPPVPSRPRKIYITDVKTRGSTRLPSGAAIRPTEMQLFLYHRLLSDLATGRLDFFRVFGRYGLDPDAPFSDAYVAQIGGLYDEIFDDDDPDPGTDVALADMETKTAETISLSSGDGTYTLPDETHNHVRYRTLRLLLGLVQDEVELTFPHGADSIGDLVSVEYRLRPQTPPKKQWQQFAQQRRRQRRRETTDTPEEAATAGVEDEDETDTDADTDTDTAASLCIGTKVLVVDRARLDSYLANYLAWWRGERPATGVTELEEASLKCGHCEFAADCSWRQALDDARVQRVRASIRAGRGQKTG